MVKKKGPKESAIRRELREHPWASRRIAYRIAKDHQRIRKRRHQR